MMTRTIALTLTLFAAACSNPADDKPRAKTEAPKPEQTAPAAAAGTKVFALGPDGSTITFKGSKPTKTHVIKVPAWKGTISMPAGKPLEARIEVEIDLTKIEADDAKLTGHLKSKDFFEVATWPTARFVSTEIKAGGGGAKGATHTIVGNLEMHGVKKSVTFPATVEVGDGGVKAKAEFWINRKDWGIVYPGMPDDLIRDEVVIILELDAKAAGA